MTYQVRAADRGRDGGWRRDVDDPAEPLPVPGKRTLSELLPPGEPGVIQAKIEQAGVPSGARPALTALFGSPGGGQPLPAEVRAKMERSLGADFADVRVHEGPEAAAIGARAYARGNHLFFAPGQYDPTSESGQRLLGHELAHVVQQRAGTARAGQAAGLPVNRDPGLEAEADRAGEHAARGERAAVAGGTRGGVAAGDTLQGDFAEDLFSLAVFLLLEALLRQVVDEGLRAIEALQRRRQLQDERERAEREAEQRAARDREQRDSTADGAEALVEVAQRALEVAHGASKEAAKPGLAAPVQEAVERARRAAATAREAPDAEAASEAYGAALAGTNEAIALACAAVAEAVRGHVARAQASRAKVPEAVKHTAKAADAAGEDAARAERAAIAARAEAQAASELVAKGELRAAIEATQRALAAARDAGEHAKAASTQARAASVHASEATQYADDASTAARDAEGSGSVTRLDSERASFGHNAEDVLEDAVRAKREASGHRDEARADAELAAPHVERAEGHADQAAKHRDGAESAAMGAQAGVVELARRQVTEHQAATAEARAQIEKLGSRAPKLATLKEHRRSVAEQVKQIAELAARLTAKVPPALDQLPVLVEQALQARSAAEKARDVARAEVCHEEARVAYEQASELARSIEQQASQVSEASHTADAALDEARKALAQAEVALDSAIRLRKEAELALGRVAMTSNDVVEAAKRADELFSQLTETLAQARQSYELADKKARAAEAAAQTVPGLAIDRGQVGKIERQRSVIEENAREVDGLGGQVESIGQLAVRATEARAQIDRASQDASRVPKATRELGASTRDGGETLTEISRGSTDARNQKRQELLVAGEQACNDVARDVDELRERALAEQYAVVNAAGRLKAVDGEPNPDAPSEGESARRVAELREAELKADVTALQKQCKALREVFDRAAQATELAAVTSTVPEVMAGAAALKEPLAAAWSKHEAMTEALSDVGAYILSREKPRDSAPRSEDRLEGFARAEPEWKPNQFFVRKYKDAWRSLASSGRVLDVGNLKAREQVPTDQSKYHSTFMELDYLATAIERDRSAFVQVGSMTFTALEAALRRSGLDAHADLFTPEQAKADAQQHGIDPKALCYEADGVIWYPDRVEVVQHKRSIAHTPSEKTARSGRSVIELEEQLLGASNQLGGFTADGGRTALGGQPETPPPGMNRTRVINIALPQADKPADLVTPTNDPSKPCYRDIILSVMARKAGDGTNTPLRYTLVDRIQITWRNASATFVHTGNGVYDPV
jgi:hypothetical protein